MAEPISMRYAVLVHKLPFECKEDALPLLSDRFLEQVSHDVVGLKLYFREYASAYKCIIKKTIRIRGVSYNICPLVTNLTLHDIRKYASEPIIRDLMAPFGPVIRLYPVEIFTKKGTYERKSLTNDYRVVLDVPELQANFNLSPLSLPISTDQTFNISFFCRLCRRNGHMQYQCRTQQLEPSFQSLASPEHERTFRDIGGFETPMNQAGFSLELCGKKHNSEQKNLIKMDQRKVKVEQDFVKDDSFVKTEFCQNVAANSINLKSEQQQCKSFKCDYLKINEDTYEKPHFFSSVSGTRNTYSNDSSNDCGNYDRIIQASPVRKFGKNDSDDEKEDSAKKVSKRNKQLKEYNRKIRNLVPPNASLKNTQELLNIALNSEPQHIPREVELELKQLLDWNHSRYEKQLNNTEKKIINWLELYLAKVTQKRIPSVISKEEEKASQPEHITDKKTSGKTLKQKWSRRQRTMSLSPGIEHIVLKTGGKLTPCLLRNFLNQVRRRKKQLEIAVRFTTDLPALCKQLEEIEKAYYLYGARGSKEDRDIDFIRRLRKRLMQKHSARERSCNSNEETCCTMQSSRNKNFPKESILKTSKCSDQPTEKSIQMLQSGSAAGSAESTKSRPQRNLCNNDQYSKISSFTVQSSTEEYPREKHKMNIQRKLAFNSQRPRITRSARISNTEAESLETFKSASQKNFRSSVQLNRISNARKRSSSGEDSREKFHTSYSFHDAQSTSKLSYVRQTSFEVGFGRKTRNRQRNSSVTGNESFGRFNYSSESNVNEKSFENFTRDLHNNLPFDIKSAHVSTTRKQSSFNETFSEVTKDDLRSILSSVSQVSDKAQFK